MFFGYIGDFGFIFYEDCGLPVKWAGVGEAVVECIDSFFLRSFSTIHRKNECMFLSRFACFSSCRVLFLRAASTDSRNLSLDFILYCLLRSRGI